MMPNNRQTM